LKETKAEIRNKLQVAVTVLEALAADKNVPEYIIKKGVEDLQEVLRILDKLEK